METNSKEDRKKETKLTGPWAAILDDSLKGIWAASGLAAAFATGLIGGLACLIVGAWGLIIGLLALIVMTSITVYLGWTTVPEREEWIVEMLGKYVFTLKPGLHILYPYFNFVNIRAAVYMGETEIDLSLNDNEPDIPGGGHVDFTDSSAPVKAKVYYQVTNSCAATYDINRGNVEQAIADRMDSAIRACLGRMKLDEANRFKGKLNFNAITNGHTVGADGKLAPPEEANAVDDTDYTKWGIEIKRLAITDIVLSKELMDSRAKLLTAEVDLEVARQEKQSMTIRAEGKKAALTLTGEGLKEQVRLLVEEGKLPPETAAGYLAILNKWEKVGDRAIVIDSSSGGGISGMTAQIVSVVEAVKQAMAKNAAPTPPAPTPQS